jgi:hypothetical protein
MAYEDFLRLSKRDRRVQRTTDLTDEVIAAVEASTMAASSEPLDGELDAKHAADCDPGRLDLSLRLPLGLAASRGQGRGRQERPCLVRDRDDDGGGAPVIRVLPITHTPPPNTADAIEIHAVTKARLGLD